MSDAPHRYRQYAGLALVLVAYLGGIVGWSCAALQVEDHPSPAVDTTQASHSDADLPQPGTHRLSSRFLAATRQEDPDPRWERRPADGRACVGGGEVVVSLNRAH